MYFDLFKFRPLYWNCPNCYPSRKFRRNSPTAFDYCCSQTDRQTDRCKHRMTLSTLSDDTCDRVLGAFLDASILVGSWLFVYRFQVVAVEMRVAGWRPLSQVDISCDAVVPSAAVIQTFLHRLRLCVLRRTDRIAVLDHLPLRVVASRPCAYEISFISPSKR